MKPSSKFIWSNHSNDLFHNERGEHFVCWFHLDFVAPVFWGGGGCDCATTFSSGGGSTTWTSSSSPCS